MSRERPDDPDDVYGVMADFVRANREPLAGFVRQKLTEAGAKPYLDGLGRSGIEALRAEAAGVLLDLACGLIYRLRPDRVWDAQEILDHFPDDLRRDVCLPRSEGYHRVLDELQKMLERRSASGGASGPLPPV
ncbi:MAG: hypothetical protein JWN86_654 [Planctomycetota bacterium]|nr:hypothetical protein [Planctomycetota bacterium]